MKLLAISKYVDGVNKKDSAVDLWRVKRPLRELQKHVDWQIDFRPAIIEDFHGLEKDPDEFIRRYGGKLAEELGQYDIIFTSYSLFTSPHQYAILWGAEHKYGTKLVVDIDDDVRDVDPSNFLFWKSAGWQGHFFLSRTTEVATRMVTTNQKLADKLRMNSDVDPKLWVIPNYIADAYPDQTIQSKDKVTIGFFGGASHYNDLHKSNVLPALQKLMHEHKNVYFKSCGQPIDDYLPRKRIELVETAQGSEWAEKRLPSMKLDIAIAPLLMTEFNQYKSNIKWQEATRVGAAFVGTNTGPYADIPDGTALLTNNTTESWYDALKTLLDAAVRKKQVRAAKKELEGWKLENHWQEYKELLEEVDNEQD